MPTGTLQTSICAGTIPLQIMTISSLFSRHDRRPRHDRLRHIIRPKRGPVPLDIRATAFQRRVWSYLQSIPFGDTRSYIEVAKAIGKPSASRAVARACATNPVAVAIPCHRVVRESGDLAGYRWGVERKQALLEMEKKPPTQAER